jgi:two-component system NtrC family sensor kinase
VERLMGRGLLGRILAIEAILFVLAAVLLPILVLKLPRASAVLYLALTFALLLVLSGIVIFSRIVRPLGRLIEAAERATAPGDELLPEEGSSDEVGRLTRALNRMVRRLHERQRALEAHLVELEARRRALETAHEALLRSERLASVGRLAAGVAHEVGNPLATIQGFLALARAETTSAEERADYLGRVEAEVDRIHRLLRDLMDYARPTPPSLGPLDPRRPVEAALKLLGPQPRFREIQVDGRYEEPLPLVLGDEARLLQVMLNLLLNAADAMQGRGRIQIRVGRLASDPQRVEIAVTDEGPGIAPEEQAHIFEPFYSTKAPGAGTGLGLAISRSIVESQGGELGVDSEPGRGATFSVRLRTAAFVSSAPAP